MAYSIQHIFNKFGDKYLEMYNAGYNKINVYNKIKTCRTKEQGIRVYKCQDCGKKKYILINHVWIDIVQHVWNLKKKYG